jgi:hypothetical protein
MDIHISFYMLRLTLLWNCGEKTIDQCCGSGSGIRDWVLFDPWIRDPGSGIGFFRIPDPGSRIPDPKTIFLRAF